MINLHIMITNAAIVSVTIVALLCGYPLALLALVMLSPPIVTADEGVEDVEDVDGISMGFIE